MTAIEFFDRTPIKNIISSLTIKPKKIIFIGDGKSMEKKSDDYLNFFKTRANKTQIVFKPILKNNINMIVKALCEIIESEEDVVFDLTGGEDLVLVAMGIVYEKYNKIKNIKMQRFNFSSGVVTDCDNDGSVIYSGKPSLTIDELIAIHGGSIRYMQKKNTATNEWNLTEDFINDINAIWNLAKGKMAAWNGHITTLGGLINETQNLKISVMTKNIKGYFDYDLMKKLEKLQVINNLKNQNDIISFSFKNEQVKKCLTKAGMALELKTFITAALAQEEGENLYSDFKNGVIIDWDGEIHNLKNIKKDTENEIDVILMNGITPIFISCKNGAIDVDELYKFDAVVNRFGGITAKKIILSTYFLDETKDKGEAICQRAYDMGIKLYKGIEKLNDEAFLKLIKNLIY